MSVESILRHLIARGFPELKRLRISIAFRVLTGGDILRYDDQAGRYLISVDECLRGATRRVLEGGIAHELAHLLADSRLPPAARELAYERHARLVRYRTRDERATEIRQIERGYGGHLLAFLKHTGRLGYTFSREHGLLRGELAARLRASTLAS